MDCGTIFEDELAHITVENPHAVSFGEVIVVSGRLRGYVAPKTLFADLLQVGNVELLKERKRWREGVELMHHQISQFDPPTL